MSSVVFRSPGVYTRERDTSGYSISKNQIRKGRINRIFDIKNKEPIIASSYGGGGFVIYTNYDVMMNKYN